MATGRPRRSRARMKTLSDVGLFLSPVACYQPYQPIFSNLSLSTQTDSKYVVERNVILQS